MKKKISTILVVMLIISSLVGCSAEPKYEKYSDTFFDTFDTITQIVGYTQTEEEFQGYVDKIHERMLELHKLFDKYNTYEGINNIKTINDNAGIEPVKVEKEIIDLILFSKDLYEKTGKETNIAMGAVLKIWSGYRDIAESDPSRAELPPMEDLLAANEHTDINKVIVDVESSTVYLEDPEMSLDVGAVAKGYATEIVAEEIQETGFTSGIISAGGNVRTIGKPLDGIRERWGIGIQNPDSYTDSTVDSVLETVFINDASVVTSGDYQRFYMVGDKVIHHLIDPKTLMPGEYYRAVSIITPDSGVADFLSTTAFLIPFEESKALIESYENAEALWVFSDGTVEATEGMKKIMKSYGATGAKAE
ncbi:FAD:protein FMN transferase [Tissierella sp. Yu-01]|uniref:FAD:protein FMN transferase n=1 Tax=Tissierella sp. Yu-01 TaxID=3035694 RepID=UPI00240DD599|nr:FAD:protein FMN transferase [Tissierella sp. Yu-01]WFA07870.1 FAD:protein FMN transferase [Tissierella sp. Yu-01]